MKNTLIYVLLAIALSGCGTIDTFNAGVADSTPIGKWVSSDADAALALAKSTNDAAAIPCWTQVKASIAAIGAAKGELGILFTMQFSRSVAIEQSKVDAVCKPAGMLL